MRSLILGLLLTTFQVHAQTAESIVNIRTSMTSTLLQDRPNIRGDFVIAPKMSLGAEIGNQSYDDNGVDVKGMSGGFI